MSENIFSAEQIRIPPELPEILKNYAKHIIKTQPLDIYSASVQYFDKLCKQRTQANNGKRLSDIQLEAFFNKFKIEEPTVTQKQIEDAAAEANIPATQIADINVLGNFTTDSVAWIKFWALLVASAAGTLFATVELATQIVGDNGQVSVQVIQQLFDGLTQFDKTVDAAGAARVKTWLDGLSGKTEIQTLLANLKTQYEGSN